MASLILFGSHYFFGILGANNGEHIPAVPAVHGYDPNYFHLPLPGSSLRYTFTEHMEKRELKERMDMEHWEQINFTGIKKHIRHMERLEDMDHKEHREYMHMRHMECMEHMKHMGPMEHTKLMELMQHTNHL